jgi:hypothetical protein
LGERGGVVGRGTIRSRKVVGSKADELIERFSIFLILPAALGPGIYSAPNRNEYQKIFLGVKCGRLLRRKK